MKWWPFRPYRMRRGGRPFMRITTIEGKRWPQGCEHRTWNLSPGGLESCAACGRPMGVLNQARGPRPDSAIYDEKS